ncbi:hypothetical protein EV361DRAFT_628007 [Lentinula raphanica]|nr:hypothetical protein EV361DRAFT_628007 [Lentinula raphanica]
MCSFFALFLPTFPPLQPQLHGNRPQDNCSLLAKGTSHSVTCSACKTSFCLTVSDSVCHKSSFSYNATFAFLTN